MAKDKERLDVLLVKRGHFSTREKAKAAIAAELVYDKYDQMLKKAGLKLDCDETFIVRGQEHPYVSRGGLKLQKAFKHFHVDPTGMIVVDIGASTGGFTDCALQHGADFVYAIDVGYNQIDWKLRSDTHHVKVIEKCNVRYLTEEHVNGVKPELATIDVSFISLKLILPSLLPVLHPSGQIIALIKPQFEAGREKVGKSGVIHDPDVQKKVLHSLLKFGQDLKLTLFGLTYSPITGGEGNIEFLVHWKLGLAEDSPIPMIDVDQVVKESHLNLG